METAKKWFAIALCLGNMLYFKRTICLSGLIDLWFSQSHCSVIDSIRETLRSPVAVIKITHFAENLNVMVLCEEYHEKLFFITQIRNNATIRRYGPILSLILRRSRTVTVWFYTSTSNKRAARPKLYTKSLTRDLKLMYSRLTLVRISINL